MLRALVLVQTEILGIHPHGVHDMNDLVRDRRDGYTQSLHGLVVDTESRIETERRERRGLEIHRIGFIGRQKSRLYLRRDRGEDLRYDTEVGFGVDTEEVIGGVDLMQAVRRDGRAADAPFACVLPSEALADITDLPFGDAETRKRGRTALVPVGGDVVLGDLRHEGRLTPPRRTHLSDGLQHIVAVLHLILDPGFLHLDGRHFRDGLEHKSFVRRS